MKAKRWFGWSWPLLAVLVAVALVASCTASETGNPVAERKMTLLARSSDDAVMLLDPVVDDGVSIEQAWIVLDDIRFESGAQCDDGDENEADIPGPIIVDLIDRPDPFELALPDAAYCRVRVRFDRAEALPAGAPSELEDAAIVLRGTRADGARFVIRSRREPEAEVRSRDEPFQLTHATASLILAFDIGRWLQGVDLEGAEPNADGVIQIDDDHDDDRLERFETNVEAAMDLFDDHDHDGSLDDDEDDNPLASSN